jgi:predicted MFS family arabinose efflux permease
VTNTEAPAGEQTPTGHIHGKKAVILTATLIVGVLAYQLNASMLSPALPAMAKAINTDTDSIAQVSSLFLLAGAVLGLAFTRWSDYIGRRKALLIVLLVLTVGTLLCVFAPNLQILLIGRVLQGASSATFNFSYLLLSSSLSPRVFGTALGFVSAINGGIGGVDGFIGGLMSDTVGFRWIFVVILVLGLIAIALSWRVIPSDTPSVPNGRMDWWGAVIIGIFLICITNMISVGSSVGWGKTTTLLWIAGTVVSAIVFVLVERRRKDALVPIHHLTSRTVWPVLMTTILTLAAVFAVLAFSLVIISESKTGYGMNAGIAALLFLTPPALTGAIAAPIAGTIAGRKGWLTTLRFGMFPVLALMILLAFVWRDEWVTLVVAAVLGIFYTGVVLTCLNGLSVVQSPPEAPAVLPAINGAGFGIGASLGITLVAPLIGKETDAGFTQGLFVSVGICVLALLMSFVIKRQVPVTTTDA